MRSPGSGMCCQLTARGARPGIQPEHVQAARDRGGHLAECILLSGSEGDQEHISKSSELALVLQTKLGQDLTNAGPFA